jgi:hypothetical protein
MSPRGTIPVGRRLVPTGPSIQWAGGPGVARAPGARLGGSYLRRRAEVPGVLPGLAQLGREAGV